MAKPVRFPKRIEGGSRLRRTQGLGFPIVPSRRDEGLHATLMKKHAADAIVIGEEAIEGVRPLLEEVYRREGLFGPDIALILNEPRKEEPKPESNAKRNAAIAAATALLLIRSRGEGRRGGRPEVQPEILTFVDRMRRKYSSEFQESVARSRVTQIEQSVDDTNKRRWNASMVSTAKADPVVPDKFGGIMVRRNPQISDAVKNNWTKLNFDLLRTSIDDPKLQRGPIVTIPDFYFDRYERILTKGRQENRRVDDIVTDLQKLTGQTIRRSDALARDQVSAHNSNLEIRRSTEAGITHFLWVSRRDRRVRSLHQERDSKLFSYKHKFSDGPPGVPPRCRCRAQPSLRRTEADPEDFRELIPITKVKPDEIAPEFLRRTKFSGPIRVESNRPALVPRLVGGDIVFGDPLAGTGFPGPRLRTRK